MADHATREALKFPLGFAAQFGFAARAVRQQLRTLVQRGGHGTGRSRQRFFLCSEEKTLHFAHVAPTRPRQHQQRKRDHREFGAQRKPGHGARTAHDALLHRLRLGERIHAPEESAEPQSRNDVEIRVARGEEDDRQLRRESAQIAAQREAAFRFVAQTDIDDRQIGQAQAKRLHRLAPGGIGGHLVAVALERLGIVGADGGVILDDRDAAGHAATIPEAPLSFFPHFSSSLCHFPSPRFAHLQHEMRIVNKEKRMTKTSTFAVELAAQIVLAAAIGLIVSIVLAGAVLLLAA